jgi:hypothetical protein
VVNKIHVEISEVRKTDMKPKKKKVPKGKRSGFFHLPCGTGD